jgi:hypothetical protein
VPPYVKMLKRSALSASRPAADTPSGRLSDGLPTILFWIGVGLAPLAAVLLLFSQAGALLRIAATLAIMSIALIGLSVTLRRDVSAVIVETEAALFEEIELLRGDIHTATKATHSTLLREVQALRAEVEALREHQSVQLAPGRNGEYGRRATSEEPPPWRAEPRQATPNDRTPEIQTHSALEPHWREAEPAEPRRFHIAPEPRFPGRAGRRAAAAGDEPGFTRVPEPVESDARHRRGASSDLRTGSLRQQPAPETSWRDHSREEEERTQSGWTPPSEYEDSSYRSPYAAGTGYGESRRSRRRAGTDYESPTDSWR